MSKDLLLEIGTEEMPASYVSSALEQLEEISRRVFSENRIGYGYQQVYGTSRRLVLYLKDVATVQEDLYTETVGPSRQVAFDTNGNPTPAAFGFARGQGVTVEELTIKKTERGEYLCALRVKKGRPTSEVLKEILPYIIRALSFPKMMRWGSSDLRFGRPIRWVLALYGEELIKFSLNGIESANMTYGHRFLKPGPFRLSSVDEYWRVLEEGYVLVDHRQRREVIKKEVEEVAASIGGKALWTDELFNNVTNLVEYPQAVLGNFNQSYLDLPAEVLITCMQRHQRYFALLDSRGDLLPTFIVIDNGTPKEYLNNVKVGNERVLEARLTDAKFFYLEDKKVSLASRLEALKHIIWQEDLGSLYDKVQRIIKLSRLLAEKVDPAVKAQAERAALLCKADLVTRMVKEFPELQGIMGREYALSSGEDKLVAQAIFEHYLPRFSGDILPRSTVGAIVSIADKLDTLVGFYGLGLIPSGSEDPYALRRQGQGIISIILERGLQLSLEELVAVALDLLKERIKKSLKETREEVLLFLQQRLESIFSEMGIRYDESEAVLAVEFQDPVDTFKRAKTLRSLRERPDFEPVTAAFKRVINILREVKEEPFFSEELLKEPEERRLYEAYLEIREKVDALVQEKRYAEALGLLALIRIPVDKFFDEVMVMAEDESLRENRLALLKSIAKLFLKIADFSKLVVSKEELKRQK